jgi:hypothetical protein
MNRRLVAVLGALALMISACTHAGSHPSKTGSAPVTQQHHTGDRVTLSGNELHYGPSIEPDPNIVYRPDVVIIGGGADAVRSVSANGLMWTIDGSAPGADDLAAGKIMLATSLGAGRVLKVTRHGADDQVLLGPASLTDVIQDADIHSEAPIALADPLYYATPGAPGSFVGSSPGEDATHTPHNAAQRRLTASQPLEQRGATHATMASSDPTLPAPTTQPTPVSLGHFRVTPFLNGKGLGIRIAESHGSGRLVGTLALRLHAPTASFTLIIRGARIVDASVKLHGAASIHVDFQAAEEDSSGSFGNETLNVPVELDFPIGGPFRLTISQSFDMALLLSGAASLQGHGDYSISGDLQFGVHNGQPAFTANTIGVADPLDRNITSLGVASNTFNAGYAVKVGISIGVPGLNAGAWFKLRVGLTVVSDVPLSALSSSCVSNSLSVDALYGVGYQLPEVVVDAVNLFLRVFGVSRIPAKGGLSWGPTNLITPPAAKYCPH